MHSSWHLPERLVFFARQLLVTPGTRGGSVTDLVPSVTATDLGVLVSAMVPTSKTVPTSVITM